MATKNHKRKNTAPAASHDEPPRETNADGVEAVYGWVLTNRAVAGAACMTDPKVPQAAWRVLAILLEYADQDGRCYVGQDTIALRLGMKKQQVQRAIKTLVRLGIIRASSRRDGVTLNYRFLRNQYKFTRANQGPVDERNEERDATRAEQKATDAARAGGEHSPEAVRLRREAVRLRRLAVEGRERREEQKREAERLRQVEIDAERRRQELEQWERERPEREERERLAAEERRRIEDERRREAEDAERERLERVRLAEEKRLERARLAEEKRRADEERRRIEDEERRRKDPEWGMFG